MQWIFVLTKCGEYSWSGINMSTIWVQSVYLKFSKKTLVLDFKENGKATAYFPPNMACSLKYLVVPFLNTITEIALNFFKMSLIFHMKYPISPIQGAPLIKEVGVYNIYLHIVLEHETDLR